MHERRVTNRKPQQANTQGKRPSSSPVAVEICNECGRSVALGGGSFVNRIPDFNDAETRRADGKPYPPGDFMCEECDKDCPWYKDLARY